MNTVIPRGCLFWTFTIGGSRGGGSRGSAPLPFFPTIVQSLVPFDHVMGERVEDIRVLQNYAPFLHNGTMYINDFKSTREHLGTFPFWFFARVRKRGNPPPYIPPSGFRPATRASPLVLGPPFSKTWIRLCLHVGNYITGAIQPIRFITFGSFSTFNYIP